MATKAKEKNRRERLNVRKHQQNGEINQADGSWRSGSHDKDGSMYTDTDKRQSARIRNK